MSKRRKIKRNENNIFNIEFKKIQGNLVLKIKIPINYNKFRKVIKNGTWASQIIKKDYNITIQISLYDIESYIEFLFNGFDRNVYIKSSILYILLYDIQEITKNKTPYNQMRNKIKIQRTIKNKFGCLYLTVSLNKDIVFSSIYRLYQNNKIEGMDENINNPTKNQDKKQFPQIASYGSTSSESQMVKQEINKIQSVHVKAIVLYNNRKCIIEDHEITDVIAIISIVQKDGSVHNISNPAVYCKQCNQYIILKNDFKAIKEKGSLLCNVIDKTPKHLLKHKNSSYSGTESKIHSLGYNVIKQGYDYTFEQRKIILANIIENYGITQHEILSIIDINIARKINLPNYADAVKKWKQDREFVVNYNFGDCPEVIIDNVIIGKRC